MLAATQKVQNARESRPGSRKPPMKPRTLVNHPPRVTLADDNRALVAPIHQTVKFEFESVAETERLLRGERDGFWYSRSGNPTTRELELLLAQLQGRDDCIVTGSGVAAVSVALLALLKQGDHVLCFVETYGPTRWLIRRLMQRFGVEHTMLSLEDRAGIGHTLASRPTQLVWFESPTNPMLKIVDVEWLVGRAHAHGALAVLDNTFAGFHNHGQFGVDLYIHSLTKYAAGHGDVMGGAIIGSRELVARMRHDAATLGPTLDPHAAFLVQRGLKTYHLRRDAQCAGAQLVAEYLAAEPRVARVHFPGLASHPGHALARAQMSDFGTIVSIDLAGTAEQGARFCESLQLFGLTASLGSTESLVMAPQFLKSREFTPTERAISGVTDTTVRLSIGIEDPDDLVADLSQALDAAFR
jgi:cystathionine beta-lyase/cystathionine gamma-synthase